MSPAIMTSLISIACISLIINTPITSSQPAFEYFGGTTVNITGQYNWTLYYPLGGICEDLNWGKILTIDITATTSQADLIFAFGTQYQYFAVTISYDQAIWVPIATRRRGACFVTPPSGGPLQESISTLAEQYARGLDFRASLISGNTTEDQTAEWELVVDDESKTNPFGKNSDQLILDIRGDRRNGKTFLSMYKNGRNGSIEMGSTWGYGQDVYLYIGLDSIHGEKFILSGIHSNDQCSWTPRPTTAIPTMDTMEPSTAPSMTPTDETNDPSVDPTIDPTADPTTDPVTNPTMDPTSDPTIDPTIEPSMEPTGYPTMEPSENTYTSTDDESEDEYTSTPVIVEDMVTYTSTSSNDGPDVENTGTDGTKVVSCMVAMLFGVIMIAIN